MNGWTVIEYTALGSVLSGVGSILGAIAIIAAAWLASNTFKGWRRQKLSERRIEQAERILTAAYKVRRGLGYARSSMLEARELGAAEKQLEQQDGWLDTPEGRRKKLILAQVHYDRLNALLDERRALDECLPMARALFGESVEKALETLNQQFHIITTAADMTIYDDDSNRDFSMKLGSSLSSASTPCSPNEMNDTIAVQIKLIEDKLLPVLRLSKSSQMPPFE